jgi:HEAT repeat protein
MKSRLIVALICGSLFLSSRPARSAAPQEPAAPQSAAMDRLIHGLQAPSTDERVAAALKLGRMGALATPAIPALVEMLHDYGPEWMTQGNKRMGAYGMTPRAAGGALANIGRPAIEPLRGALNRPGATKDEVLWRATALAYMNQPEATDALLAILEQPAFPYPSEVARAMAESPDPRVLAALLQHADSPDPRTRRAAVAGLAHSKDPKAVDALANALRDSDNEVRRSAASGLFRAADKRSVDALTAALKDSDESVRNVSAQALGAIGDRRAIGPLVAAVSTDPGEWVRLQAGCALEGLTGKLFGDNGDKWRKWWDKQQEKGPAAGLAGTSHVRRSSSCASAGQEAPDARISMPVMMPL